MQLTQITYKQTVSYKPYHSITMEAVATIETGDNLEEAYRNLSGWVSQKLQQSAERENTHQPKPLKPEDMY